MKKAAVIKNVEVKDGKYTVTYESGTRRTYKKATKTVEAWLAQKEAKAEEERRRKEAAGITGDPYFKTEAAKIIFYLVELDGEERMKRLNITRNHYYSKELARAWMSSIQRIVHPDVCDHPYAAKATHNLIELYKSMTR